MLKHFFRRSPFRHILFLDAARIPCFGNIKVAIAASELIYIGFAVVTGADNVLVLFAVAGSQATGANHIAVTILVGDQGFKQVHDPLFFRIEIVALCFLHLFQLLEKSLSVH